MSRRDDRVSLVDMLIYAREAVALWDDGACHPRPGVAMFRKRRRS